MRRLIRNIAGEPRPLIMHRRLRWLVEINSVIRCAWAMLARTPYRRQMYTRPQMPEEERSLQRESIRNFLGGRSPNPVVARYYRERSRQALLASDDVGAQRKQELQAAGPLCIPEDEAAVMARRAEVAQERVMEVAP